MQKCMRTRPLTPLAGFARPTKIQSQSNKHHKHHKQNKPHKQHKQHTNILSYPGVLRGSFDGIDINYEAELTTAEQRLFLVDLTRYLRADLPAGALLTHTTSAFFGSAVMFM